MKFIMIAFAYGAVLAGLPAHVANQYTINYKNSNNLYAFNVALAWPQKSGILADGFHIMAVKQRTLAPFIKGNLPCGFVPDVS